MNPYDKSEEDTAEKENRNLVMPVGVAFGVVLTTLTLCGVGFGTSIWWASSISTKMDVIVKQSAEQSAVALAQGTRITALELWQRQVDAVGTPTMQKRTEEISKDLEKLREDFNLHKAVSK